MKVETDWRFHFFLSYIRVWQANMSHPSVHDRFVAMCADHFEFTCAPVFPTPRIFPCSVAVSREEKLQNEQEWQMWNARRADQCREFIVMFELLYLQKFEQYIESLHDVSEMNVCNDRLYIAFMRWIKDTASGTE